MKARIKRDRRLRRAVVRLRGCLGGLTRADRRVLVLRAGLGKARPRPRGRVASILEVPARRVARIERRALRNLRTLARQDCGATIDTADTADVVDGGADTELAAATVPSAVSAPSVRESDTEPGRGGGDRSQVKGERAESRKETPASRGFGGLIIPREGSIPLVIPLALVALLIGGGAYFLLRRRRDQRRYVGY